MVRIWPGFTMIQIPMAVASTIHTALSTVRVRRLRIRPYQPSHTAPRMVIVGRRGRHTPSRSWMMTPSTMSLKFESNPSDVAAW
ncbi:hypothetical protein CDO52_06855 [Nocardiopsis gilva YIM 90087]|uniref:Uncharacterized protein n=1 Tax=Nocardiopsis gilva YIM 90087 TaxID=1235441 RepID=A0A223SDA3_9ACTN|nr:hypothetical protein CDO52_06855 [Nocardiopsis gilva YIM 90087]